tara:strand:+ start:4187 stop:4690 length:504 start_codon:yes stop_codon:yes gene_type:complete
MRNNIFKSSLVLVMLFLLSSCGFKPIYKLSNNVIDLRSFSVEILNENTTSREIKEEIKNSLPPNSNVEKSYIIEILIDENLVPLITNTDGTVAKYRIEIIMNFKVKGKNNDSYLIEDMVRGFAQYTVETSEIESDDKKKRMIRTATNSAVQMMISKIQSDASITNDN